jgi:hypothetical protein
MKLFVCTLLLLCWGGFAHAQNTFNVRNEVSSGTIGTMRIYYSDNSTQEVDIGANGNYTFFIALREVSYVLVRDVECHVGESAEFRLSDGRAVVITITESIQDEARSFYSLIR